MTSLTIRLAPESPTPNPAPGAGGMGLPTKPARELCKAILKTYSAIRTRHLLHVLHRTIKSLRWTATAP